MAVTKNLAELDAEIKATKEALLQVHGTETEVYARIVGYYRSVRNWNKGKRDEYNNRRLFQYELDAADTRCDCAPIARTTVVQHPASIHLTSDSTPVYYELFVRTTCPNCPPVREAISRLPLTGNMIDVDSNAGLEKASELGIYAAPTAVFYDAQGMECGRAYTSADVAKIAESVAVPA